MWVQRQHNPKCVSGLSCVYTSTIKGSEFLLRNWILIGKRGNIQQHVVYRYTTNAQKTLENKSTEIHSGRSCYLLPCWQTTQDLMVLKNNHCIMLRDFAGQEFGRGTVGMALPCSTVP